MKFLRNWYYEGEKFERSDDFASQNFAIKGSIVEIVLFYVSLISLIIFSFIIWIYGFSLKSLVLFIPTLIWMFLRISRKNMTAAANLISAIFGAIGGASLFLLAKLLEK